MTTKTTTILVALMLSSAAYATHPPAPTPEPDPRAVADADAAAKAAAAAKAQAEAEAAAIAKQQQEAAATASASNGGNTQGVQIRTRALGLDLPGHAGAPAVDGCHESRGSVGALGAGSGGRVRINAECAKREACLEIARMYLDAGQGVLFVAQLATPECGGVPGATYTPPVMAQPEDPSPATRAYIEEVFKRTQRK